MMSDDDSDETLVARAVAGDRCGFATLVEPHYDMMFRVAWKWCGSREDAEDIVQGVCLRLARSLVRFEGRSEFSTWLYRIVLNATHDHHRKRQSHNRKLAGWANEPTRAEIQPEVQNSGEDQANELWIAVRQLPPGQRDAVMLVFAERLSHKQAAQVLGCAAGTISSNIHDAKKNLKRLLTMEALV